MGFAMHSFSGLELVGSFLVLAEELNFRRSAERLNVDQSALTRRIQKLEYFLGFKLLERTTREVTLTEAGRSFYRDNLAMVEGYANSVSAARRVAKGHKGALRLGYMTFAASQLMPRCLGQFKEAYPYVRVDTVYMRTQAQKLALVNREIDAAFIIGSFDHPDYESFVLSNEPMYALLPRHHPLAQLKTVTPADLAKQPLVLGDMQEWDEYRWWLNERFNGEGVSVEPSVEMAHPFAIAGCVAAGLGVSIFPKCFVDMLGPEVWTRRIDHQAFHLKISLVWSTSKKSQELLNFIEIAKELGKG